MTTQPQPQKKPMQDPIVMTWKALWGALTIVLGPLYPVVTALEKAWAAAVVPLIAWFAKTKVLDSLQWSIVAGLVVLGVTLLIIRIVVNV